MLADDVLAFARAALPSPPARVLEVGAGQGELAAALRTAGFDVRAVDPAAEAGSGVEPVALLDVQGTFDAALAVLSLHHVEPLDRSCAHLGSLVRPGGRLVVDELDVERFDERAAVWWLGQQRALGPAHDHDPDAHHHDPAALVADMRAHVHPLQAVRDALLPYFALGEPVPGAYLHRWHLEPGLRDVEERLIAAGRLPATGARLVGVRRAAAG